MDGVNFAALGLMLGITWQIAVSALIDPLTGGLALIGLILLLRFQVGAHWVILCGALVGVLRLVAGG